MNISLLQLLSYAFLAVAGIQVFYYLFFFSRPAFFRSKKEEEKTSLPPLSVIICAKDERHNLVKNLPSILQQHYVNEAGEKNFEVIVVNDNSEDDTLYYLQDEALEYDNFRYINITQEAKGIAGKKYALTLGIKKAENDIVVLTDADCRTGGENWLYQIGKSFKSGNEITLGYGAYEVQPGLLNRVIRFETFFSGMQYLSFALAGIPYMGVGRNLAYKKELFFKYKGFLTHNNIPSGDDDLFINAAANGRNTKVALHKEAITYSRPKQSWDAWYRQKTRHFSTGKYYKFKHKFLLGLFSISLFLYYPLFAAALFYQPWFYIVLIAFGGKWIVQSVIWAFCLKKMNEKGLFWYCFPFEILMSVYYLIFIPALILKPKKRWS